MAEQIDCKERLDTDEMARRNHSDHAMQPMIHAQIFNGRLLCRGVGGKLHSGTAVRLFSLLSIFPPVPLPLHYSW